MNRSRTTETRRAALKALVPLVHLTARGYELGPGGYGEVRPEDALIARELRRLGGLMDRLAENAGATVLAAFFGAPRRS